MTDSQVDRKTAAATTGTAKLSKVNVIQSGKKNPLNSYRSYNYVWTLAALRKDVVNDPALYRQSSLDFIILKTGGKGITGIGTNVSSVDRVSAQEEYEVEIEKDVPFYSAGELAGYTKEKVKEKRKKNVFSKDFSGKQLVESFNKKSPGRFDFYIDNVEIETIMAFTQNGGTTLPSSFKFKVFEPYSINGFIEALHVSAVAAGYVSYTQASFVLKLEFIGYPDNDATVFQGSQIVENSTRFFTIKFSGVDVEIGDRGTMYSCSAIPWNDAAFGRPNVLRRPIAISGNTVAEILTNFANNLNEQNKNDDAKAKVSAKDFDEYEIKFPTRTETGLNYNDINEIGKSNLQTILKNNAIYKFPDPGQQTQQQTPIQKDNAPEEVKLHPTAGTPIQVQFAEKQQINEIIAAIIRDSEYIKNIIKEQKIDGNGFIDYFLIKSSIVNKEEIDPTTRKPYQKFTYSVLPYKIHFTRIPGYANQKFDSSRLTALSLREYNYIYTGQNVDVLNFRLNFDKLFFEALPVAMGNNSQPGARDSGAQPNSTGRQLNASNLQNEITDQIGSPMQFQVPVDHSQDGANASQPSTDPYYVLAKNLHSAIIDSKASLVKGEMEIIGDPFYLVTGGIGNYDPKPGNIPGTTADGEADHQQREVLITINFRNPIDINPLEKGGMMYFETEKLPFSGVYRVTRVVNTFIEGVFKQKLEIIRYPGQIIGKTKETVISEAFTETKKVGDQTVANTTQGQNVGGRAASFNGLFQLLSRGLPSPGLPGALSNFIGQQGGLGGANSSLLNQVSGSISRGLGNLTGANSVFGANSPASVSQLATGIRLKAAGLFNLNESNLANVASLQQSSNILESKLPSENGIEQLSNNIVSRTKNLLNRISIQGSGIGEGASVAVNRVDESQEPSQPVKDKATVDIQSVQLTAQNNFTPLGEQINNVGTQFVDRIKSIGGEASKLLSNVGNKITNLTNSTPNDPEAIAAKFGIDASQLSGISPEFKTKIVKQLTDLSKQIPEDTNLRIAAARGLILDNISQDKLKNIPPTPSYLTAPYPDNDPAFVQSLQDNRGVLNLPTTVNSSDITSITDKFAGANTLVQSITNEFRSVEATKIVSEERIGNTLVQATKNINVSVVEKYGSKTVSISPLDKLFS